MGFLSVRLLALLFFPKWLLATSPNSEDGVTRATVRVDFSFPKKKLKQLQKSLAVMEFEPTMWGTGQKSVQNCGIFTNLFSQSKLVTALVEFRALPCRCSLVHFLVYHERPTFTFLSFRQFIGPTSYRKCGKPKDLRDNSFLAFCNSPSFSFSGLSLKRIKESCLNEIWLHMNYLHVLSSL